MGGEILSRQFYRIGLFHSRRGAVLAVLVLAAVALLAAALESPPSAVAGRASASDGDSFRLGDHRIRLTGLDAPELAQRCDTNDGATWPCGRVARDRMAALLSSGPLNCQPEGRDRYDRLLATCTIGGRDLGSILVGEGFAISTNDYPMQEATAQEQRLGIWIGGFDTPRQWRDDHARPAGVFDWLWGHLL